MKFALLDMIMQLRSKGISDTGVLRAIETVDRASFVQVQHAHSHAYELRSLPIACGQSLPDPWLIAAMTQAAEIKADHKVLEIGTGSGYHTAILAQLCRRVYSVERYNELSVAAQARLDHCQINNAVLRHGDGRYGWRGQAPFDRIVVTAGLSSPPGTLCGQLVNGGVLVAVVEGQLAVYTKTADETRSRILLPANLPMLEAGKSKAL